MAKKGEKAQQAYMNKASDLHRQGYDLFRTDPAKAKDLYLQAAKESNNAYDAAPKSALAKSAKANAGRFRGLANDDDLRILINNSQGNLEKSVTPILIGAIGAFALVFLSNGITGNAIGSSGSSMDNMMMGSLFLVVALVAVFLLFKNKNPKPLPHPEKTRPKKSKAKKSHKK